MELVVYPAMLHGRGSNPQRTRLTWKRRAAAMLGRILHLTMYWTRGFAAAGAFARMSSLMLSQPCKKSVLSTKILQPAAEFFRESPLGRTRSIQLHA